MRRRALEAAAAAAGMKLAPAPRTATLPTVRCTEDERKIVAHLATLRRMSLADHLRTRALAPITNEEIRASNAKVGGSS